MDSLDYSSFLLSCSPPQFDTSLFNCLNLCASTRPPDNRRSTVSDEVSHGNGGYTTSSPQINSIDYDELDDIIDISFKPPHERETTLNRDKRIKAWETTYDSKSFDSDLILKKVNFADETGRRLTEEYDFKGSFETSSDLSSCGSTQDCLSLYHLNFDLALPAKEFASKLLKQNICLEQVSISGDSVFGVVWVCNSNKEDNIVTMRFSYNNWETFSDQGAVFARKCVLPGQAETNCELFEFELLLANNLMTSGQGLIFAIRVTTATGEEFWDNNEDKNYVLKLK